MIAPRLALAALLVLSATPAFASVAFAQDVVRKIPAPHGEVIIANARQQQSYDAIH